MERYLNSFFEAFKSTLDWTWDLITFDVPWYTNYFWGLIFVSLVVWSLEIAFPWRKYQSIFRKDFWLDGFYMFFNFFVFTIVISGFYKVLNLLFSQFGILNNSFAIVNLQSLPEWLQLLIFFVLLDFVQWLTHILLHRFPFLWQFHKVHHSVKEMGFAAHFRYHWMENVLYKPMKTLAVMLLGGFEPEQAYIVHFVSIVIGHLNHANLKITWGVLKYIFNNPVMHLYHHAYHVPKGKFGVNFGISLSIWDYLFKTNYVPDDRGTIELGFKGDDQFPKAFWGKTHTDFTKNRLYIYLAKVVE